eukprot:jgi/Psemu1/47547/gm1.47547_g
MSMRAMSMRASDLSRLPLPRPDVWIGSDPGLAWPGPARPGLPNQTNTALTTAELLSTNRGPPAPDLHGQRGRNQPKATHKRLIFRNNGPLPALPLPRGGSRHAAPHGRSGEQRQQQQEPQPQQPQRRSCCLDSRVKRGRCTRADRWRPPTEAEAPVGRWQAVFVGIAESNGRKRKRTRTRTRKRAAGRRQQQHQRQCTNRNTNSNTNRNTNSTNSKNLTDDPAACSEEAETETADETEALHARDATRANPESPGESRGVEQ